MNTWISGKRMTFIGLSDRELTQVLHCDIFNIALKQIKCFLPNLNSWI